jgi:hypothetical protein
MDRLVRLILDLPADEALALAQFLKRVGIDDYRDLAIDDDEAWVMQAAGERVRAALAAAGYAPR